MRTRRFQPLVAACLVALIPTPRDADAQTSMALTGLVTSGGDGAMEGVLVSAKKPGSTMTITVVSDQQGRYRFPAAKLELGRYDLNVRAVGFELGRPVDTKTGTFTEYLLPRQTNIRRVFVDSSTTPPTFWVGNNHGAAVIKLEPLD